MAPEHFKWTSGEEYVGRYEPEDAKHFATGFCKNCGSSLPWMGQTKKAVVVPAGSLDHAPDIKPFQNIFWGSRATWYQEASELPKHEELPVKK